MGGPTKFSSLSTLEHQSWDQLSNIFIQILLNEFYYSSKFEDFGSGITTHARRPSSLAKKGFVTFMKLYYLIYRETANLRS